MARIGTYCEKCHVAIPKGTLNCPRCGRLTVVGPLPPGPRRLPPVNDRGYNFLPVVAGRKSADNRSKTRLEYSGENVDE